MFSKDSTVRLFKTVVGKTGNIYYPGVYGPHDPLPEKFMTEQYTELISGERVEKELDSNVETEFKSSPGLVDSIVLNKNVGSVQEIDLSPKSSFEPVAKLNINSAAKKDIVALQGIGTKTAEKIIELRELFAFADYTDLNARVPLAFGRDWNEFNLEF